MKKNGTDGGLYETYSGIGDFKKIGMIKRWQRKSTIKYWLNTTDGRPSVCNMINGSDASQFEPLIEDPLALKLYIFNTDICRLVHHSVEISLSFLTNKNFRIVLQFSSTAFQQKN